MAQFTDIDAAITRRLYKASTLSNIAGCATALLLAFGIEQTRLFSSAVYLWLGLILSSYLSRLYLSLKFQRNNQPNMYWLNKFRLGITITGILWGVACFLLFPTTLVGQSLLIFAIIGINAAAVISYSVDLKSLFGFTLPIFLALLARLYIQDTTTASPMSIMLILFYIFIVISSRASHNTLIQNIRLATVAATREKREKSYTRIMEMIANNAPVIDTLEQIIIGMEAPNPEIICSIVLLDNSGKSVLRCIAPNLPDFYNKTLEGMQIGPNVGSCGASSYTGMRVIVEDIASHPNWAPYKDLAKQAGLAACWSEPIKNSSGKVLGALAIYHRQPASPTDEYVEIMMHNAYLAGIAIERAESNQEQLLAALLYQNSSETMMITDANNTIIAVNPAFTAVTGYTADEVIGRNPNMLSSGRHNKAFYDELWHQLNNTGKWTGEIWNRKKNGELFLEWIRINTIYDAKGNVVNRLGFATDITEKKESEDTIWRQANFDALTNLPNRRMFNDRLDQAIKKARRTELPLALMFIDLDQFKEVNDTLGHAMGDVLLIEAARRLAACVRDTDTVSHEDNVISRLGGDEFTILLSEVRDNNCVERIAQRILDKMAEPFQLGTEIVYISASIGITLYPTDSTDVDTLLKNADQAMYAAKKMGRNRFSFFTSSMQKTAQSRMRLSKDLRTAVNKKQFHLVYQPIVNLATNNIDKAEALIRWPHPALGNISPAEFIPIAEDTGLIIDIGNWVFKEAVQQVIQWRKSFHPDFQISINKSPVQFYNLTSSVNKTHFSWADYLKKMKLPGQSISVEITERLLLDSGSSIREQLLEFRDSGIQVSLDDFGTGYSSLSYIKKFDIDYIKIDQSFVRNLETQPDDMAVCEAIIVMAHKLNMKVVAEGVETEQQFNLLKTAGCDYGQGYYFSKPLPAEEFEKLFD